MSGSTEGAKREVSIGKAFKSTLKHTLYLNRGFTTTCTTSLRSEQQ